MKAGFIWRPGTHVRLVSRLMHDWDYARLVIARRIAGDIVLSDNPGEAMKKWREYFEVSQNEIARKMGVSPSVISDYEKGRRYPGAKFVRKYVSSLIEIDAKRGLNKISELAYTVGVPPNAVLDMREFEKPLTVASIADAVKGVILAAKDKSGRRVYGYTVVDSINAIMSLTGMQFTLLFGSVPDRAIVFTNSRFGRSPMVAVRVAPIKPAVVVIHGPRRDKDVDPLAINLAEAEGIPLILSLASSREELVDRLKMLARRASLTGLLEA